MKNIRLYFAFAFMMLGFAACEDDSAKPTLKSDVAPNVLSEPSENSFVLTMEDKDAVLETFEWTPTDYGFQAAVSYKLQIDKAGNNFANAVDLVTTNDVEAEIKVGSFNDLLLALELAPEEAANIEMRVASTVHPSVEPVYSNTTTFQVSPYATSFPPIYGMGAALNGWGPWPTNAVEWQSSEFKKYETVAYFKNGEAFRWFNQLDWGPTSYNYPFFTSVAALFENANDGDSNLKVAGASGWYKVTVNLAAKTVTAESVDEPLLYMVGAGVGGWDQAKAVKMTYIKPGVFKGSADFTNDTFRFFAQHDWGPTSYNYPFFTSVDPKFENGNDGDKNLKFIGTPGNYSITVDLNAKTVVVN